MSIVNYAVSGSASWGLVGRHFRLLDSSNPVIVELVSDSGTLRSECAAGQKISLPASSAPFTEVRIETGSPQSLKFWAGLADFDVALGGVLTTVASGSGSVGHGVATVTDAGAAVLVPAQAGRRSVLIVPDGEIYVGGAGVTAADGVLVDGSITLETSGDVYAVSDFGNVEVRYLTEVN